MPDHHRHHHHATPTASQLTDLPRYRRIIWIALVAHGLMFLAEMSAGFRSGSLSLLADAINFAGDAANYAVSLAVLSAALAWRARGLAQVGMHAGLRPVRARPRAVLPVVGGHARPRDHGAMRTIESH